MFTITIILLALLAGFILSFIIFIFQALIKKVNVLEKNKSQSIIEVASLDSSKEFGINTADAYLMNDHDKKPIGRVTSEDSACWVEFQHVSKSSAKHIYKRYGYVDSEGYLYSTLKGESTKRIGYLAKPSEPNTPSLEGERSFKDLWLVKRLNVYIGSPGTVFTLKGKQKPTKDKKSKKQDDSEANVPPSGPVQQTESNLPSENVQPAETNQPTDNKAYGDEKVFNQKENVPEQNSVESPDKAIVLIDEDSASRILENPPRNTSYVDDDDYQVVAVGEKEDSISEEAPKSEGVTEPVNANAPEGSNEPVQTAAPEEIVSPEETPAPSETVLDAPELVHNSTAELDSSSAHVESSEPEEKATDESAPVVSETEPSESQNPAAPESSESEIQSPAEPESVYTASVSPEAVESVVSEEDAIDEGYVQDIKTNHPEIIEKIYAQMVKVNGGTFTMGANASENTNPDYSVEPNEGPAHPVTLDSYYISKFPITQDIWNVIMGYNPSMAVDDTFPVAPVTWNECHNFIIRLRKITSIDFNLPTEAQWEFAARGGNDTRNYIYSGGNTFSEVGCDNYNNPVGTKRPNELGLYDMSGLVREWTDDVYCDYTEAAQINPHITDNPDPLVEKRMAVRSPAGNCSVTNRKGEAPEEIAFKSYGFRIVCTSIPEASIQQKMSPAILVGQGTKRGIGSLGWDSFSDEAKAAAFAGIDYLYGKRPKSDYSESSPYGWLDTALLSAFVYTAIYMVIYLVVSVIFQFPLYDMEHEKLSSNISSLFYFVVWIIVRTIKVACAESGNSIQPQLELFNKSIGVLAFDIAVIVISLLFWFDVDFIPVVRAILFAVILNLLSGVTRKKWDVINPYTAFEDDDNDEEFVDEKGKLLPPTGDNLVQYEWTLDSFYDKKVNGTLSMSFYVNYIDDLRSQNPFYIEMPSYSYKTYVLRMENMVLRDYRMKYHVDYLAQEILRIAEKHELTELDTVQFALDFIQKPNINYAQDDHSSRIGKPVEYMRFPDETLYDKEGDCDCKSFLAFMLYHSMGFNVLFMLSDELEHAAVAVNLTDESWKDVIKPKDMDDIVYNYGGRDYIYCETTNDYFKVGFIPEGESVNQFNTKIELLCEDEED